MQLWKIVGGADKGGILVRQGPSVKSPQLPERLSTDAIVSERELQGERLNYVLRSGTGPKEGWVSVRLKDNELAIRMFEKEEDLFPDMDKMGSATATNGEGQEKLDDISARCEREIARPKIVWRNIDIEWVYANYAQRCPGMFYGLEFPWNEEMLLEFGPKWLTKAFQTAGTLDASNSVTEITHVKRHAFGNNGGKTLFEVKYKNPSPGLHTKLFAKYPFDMDDKKQKADSVAQRVYKQPQDFTEVNFYRLMEKYIPFKTPKFYYGDISNESTNWIMITEQLEFNDPGTKEPLPPFQFEGPYDKAMDWTLRGAAHEYYYVLAEKGAIMAALHMTGKLAPESVLDQFENTAKKSADSYGMQAGISGDPFFKAKLEQAEAFMFDVASKIFPPEIMQPGFRERWRKTMLTVNAYMMESWYYRHGAFPQYVAFTHQNLNVDNAFFWRDEKGDLDAGIFDWGNQKALGLGHIFYWWVYVSEWEMLEEHFHNIMDFFLAVLESHGGPKLDRKRFYTMTILAALEHNAQIVPTIPLIYKMCPKRNFATITSRKDDRIFQAVDGKSTCRVYLHCWCNQIHMMQKWKACEELDKWIADVADGPLAWPRKDIDALYK